MTCNDIRYQLHCFEVSNIAIILFEYHLNVSYDRCGVAISGFGVFDNWKIFDVDYFSNKLINWRFYSSIESVKIEEVERILYTF